MLVSTGKEEERLALAETTGLLNLGSSSVARYLLRNKDHDKSGVRGVIGQKAPVTPSRFARTADRGES